MQVLQGENVLLHPMRLANIPRQREFFKDAELAWLDSNSPEGYQQIDVEALFETRLKGDRDCIRLGIEAKGDYVGFCSLMNTASTDKVIELGINIGDRRYWNRGLGREVVGLLLHYGFDQLGAREIELTTHTKNKRAIRCFTAMGFREKKRIPNATRYYDEQVDMIEMALDSATWQSGGRHLDSPD